MTRIERWNALLELVATAGHLNVAVAAESLGVSEATIRRDLDQLAEQRMLTRTRGGAVSSGQLSYELPLRYKTERNAAGKQLIGRAAARLIESGETVALNGGTTTLEVARALAERDMAASVIPGQQPVLTRDLGVTVVTNALSIAGELAVRPQIKLVVTGGVARPESYELIGPLATYVLGDLTFDWAILGVDGLDPVAGATAHHEGEASINRLMTERALRVAIVADCSKLGRRAFARVCGTDRISAMVTDAPAPGDATASAALTALAERGIRVITV